ncbi:DUF3617 domain-containing protein [Sphingobium nicotianae]|uniref:DUF3617 family protein n=1 Tax=Sphingobium nicotianae TaxID=2782607 RepID=A0A9X1IS22_9SPHN|nr:DUF3617 domain-containing protein [Sphingobium nicotianae]MBT2187904.1 DUF3617 family protein [Sphingobium nicotianae]
MRPVPLTAALILPLALAACDKGGPTVSATNASTAEVQEKVAAASGGGDALMVEPGRWEGTMTMHDIQLAGMDKMPPAARAQMISQMGKAKTIISCVTPEEVKAKNGFFKGLDDKSCKYDHFTLAGGKLDAAMSCAHDGGAKVSMTMNGSYSPQAYHMDIASRTSGNSPMGMSMKMTMDAKRVGACRGTPDES